MKHTQIAMKKAICFQYTSLGEGLVRGDALIRVEYAGAKDGNTKFMIGWKH